MSDTDQPAIITVNGQSKLQAYCHGCGHLIADGDKKVDALGVEWHHSCFVCHDCHCSLSTWYVEKEGHLYCKEHYWSRIGEACNRCGYNITGPIMFAGQHRYHPECFICTKCRCVIGYGEAYSMIERSKLYCLNQTTCELQVGDRILEVNGEPVKEQSIVEINSLLREQKPLFLLVERQSGFSSSSSDTPLPNNNNNHNHSVPSSSNNNVNNNNVVSTVTLPMTQLVATLPLHCSSSAEQLQLSGAEQVTDDLSGDLVSSRNSAEATTVVDDDEDDDQESKDSLPFTDSHSRSGNSAAAALSSNQQMAVHSTQLIVREEGSKNIRLRNPGCMRRRSTLPRGFSTGSDPRSQSMTAGVQEKREVSRTCSLKPLPGQRVFRPIDLIRGEVLGQGFFGQAIKVTDRKTGEVMVLKELLEISKEAQDNFLKEVSVLRSLTHPNVLRFIGILYKDKRVNLITEFAPGGTLQARITKTVLPWLQRIKYAHNIACGMEYLHSKDIVHRDLNSGNCLLKQDDTVVVADFGLARSLTARDYRVVTDHSSSPPPVSPVSKNDDHVAVLHRRMQYRRQRCRTIVGNPFFMAPEMMHGQAYDEKVDVFSYGIVLCEIISRVEADPDYVPRARNFGLDVEAFREKYGDGCPAEFLQLTIRCCCMTPSDRPTFEELNVALKALMSSLEE